MALLPGNPGSSPVQSFIFWIRTNFEGMKRRYCYGGRASVVAVQRPREQDPKMIIVTNSQFVTVYDLA
jgi:hypothetical protein